jgi:hypothetical protein
MLRSIGAVLAGYIAIGILVVLTDQVVWKMNPGDWKPGQTVPAYYFVVSLFTAPLYSVFGGYLCAWLAKAKPWQHIIALVIFGELMGLASTVMAWKMQPHWYAFALLLLYPPCVFLGGYLRLRRKIGAEPGFSGSPRG